jgi:polyisoprenoid-binding protein YceI
MTPESAIRSKRYLLVPGEGTFTVQAFAEGLFSAFGHDPVIAVRDFTGELDFVAGTFEDASAKISVNADSLAVVSDVKDKDRQEIENMMRGEVLETSKFPEIVFTSNNITVSRLREGAYRARAIGDLTLHGVTQNNLWITAQVIVSGDDLRVKGEYQVRQTDYKIKLVSVAGGTLKIKNEVKCSFDLVARREE